MPIPYGIRVATEWSWRLLIIAAAIAVLAYILVQIQVVVIPVFVALLATALLLPAVDGLTRLGVRRGLASALTLVGVLLFVGGLLALAGQQIATGFQDLYQQVVTGVEKVRAWLVHGPLHISERQIDSAFASVQRAIGRIQITQGVLFVGTTVSHVVAGFFVALFATYFMLYQGERIWGWTVRLFPRRARTEVDSSGRRGFGSLEAFVRATLIVALVDSVGITIVALILRVPLAFPIGVLVFLGAFVPIVGSLIAGSVAVIVALVAHGPVVGALMLGGVILVQQLEAHVLQPFLLGRLVKLHPLAVILAITAGAYLGGIAGALFAVPTVAVVNGVVQHLADERAAAAAAAARPSARRRSR
ncbi:AI-2E family transporter [Actinopolymorpha alba]|uniref:AI-2E family transporter n=1 Tax=Actinopolymorpha alba TaxID=533267 RepID=UPI00037B8F47|nr:AI-2E family transporter [Actinopolymorpha alba]